MRKIQLAAIALVLTVFISGTYLAYTYVSNLGLDDTSTSVSIEQIRDSAILYLAANYTVSMPLMGNVSWGHPQQITVPGSETYIFYSGGWSVSIYHPVVPNPVYAVYANYSEPGVMLSWVADYQNGVFCERSNDFNNGTKTNLTQDQIRDISIFYLKTFRSQTVPYMQGMMTWTGGRMSMGMLIGADKYSYQNSGWNVTMQYPVVPHPLYNITIEYNSTPFHQMASPAVIYWQGTLQNGTITETDFQFNP